MEGLPRRMFAGPPRKARILGRMDMRNDQALRAGIQKPCSIWINRQGNAHERRDPRFKTGARDLHGGLDSDGASALLFIEMCVDPFQQHTCDLVAV